MQASRIAVLAPVSTHCESCINKSTRDLLILNSLLQKRFEHQLVRVQRYCHDYQHPAVQEQGVLGYALGVDLGGHGIKCDNWAIDLSNLTTNSCGASLCWASGFPLSASVR